MQDRRGVSALGDAVHEVGRGGGGILLRGTASHAVK